MEILSPKGIHSEPLSPSPEKPVFSAAANNSHEVKPLSDEVINQIWTAINMHMADDDTSPSQVIEENFEGNADRYLRCMAGWHNIKID